MEHGQSQIQSSLEHSPESYIDRELAVLRKKVKDQSNELIALGNTVQELEVKIAMYTKSTTRSIDMYLMGQHSESVVSFLRYIKNCQEIFD